MRGVKLKFTRYLMSCSCSRWSCWSHWRTWLTVVVVVTYTIVLLVVLPLMIYGLYAVDAEATFSAWFIGGLFTLLTIPIFLANLLQVKLKGQPKFKFNVIIIVSCIVL